MTTTDTTETSETTVQVPVARPVYEAQYLARDLPYIPIAPKNLQLVVQIEGRWREVFDVHTDLYELLAQYFGVQQDDDEARAFFTRMYDKSTADQLVTKLGGDQRLYVAVRYLIEEKSTDVDVEDAWHIFRAIEPVAVLRRTD